MAQQIGMDPVELEGLVQKFIDENRAAFDGLAPDAKQPFRKALAEQIETMCRLLDETRTKTINQVLQIVEVVERVERVPYLLKSSIIKFRDEA